MTSRSRSPRGKLIVLEGPDGVGKSTLTSLVVHQLQEQGERCQLLTFPGREPGSLGRLVYDVHHEPQRFGIESMSDSSKQALHIAAHLDAIEQKIFPLLQSGVHVVLDRFWWSTWVYGIVAGIDRPVLRRLIDVELALWGRVRPVVAILLRRLSPIDREDDLVQWQALRHEYDLLAKQEQARYPVMLVDNVGTLEETLTTVMAHIADRLKPQPNRDKEPPAGTSGQLSLGLSTPSNSQASQSSEPRHFAHMAPSRPTAVYDTYWRFAAERQRIFFRRLRREPPPWTIDPVLVRHKFTNAYRASDRVSQYLIRSVIYRADLPASAEEVFFRIILFKLFNKIETWTLLEHAIGPLTYLDYQFDRYDAVLSRAMDSGQRIYSGAYIMPPGSGAFGERAKHRNHLRLLERMMTNEAPKRLAEARSMQRGFELLRSFPTIGDFLAYQFVTDINYSEMTNWSEGEFVVPGPGALDGIRKCFSDLGGLNPPEMIRFMVDRQEREFSRLDLEFQSLWGRSLQLIDCQNLFCEVDKYARVAHPEIRGLSGRSRIKQRFTPHPEEARFWYPPKWGINDAVQATQSIEWTSLDEESR
jgi:thymidylate kinase